MRNSKNMWIWIAVLLIAAVVVVVLVLRAGKNTPSTVGGDTDASQVADDQNTGQRGPLAMVENVSMEVLESFPVQVRALVSGQLNDGCTELDEAYVDFDQESDTFSVAVTTKRDDTLVCTQALVPFNDVIPLDVLNMPAGTYKVDINGVVSAFTLDADNYVAGAELVDGK